MTTNLKGRALKRALKTNSHHRLYDVPLITDSTEYITPDIAEKMLGKNKNNRPINWNKVEEYRRLMEEGKWKLHSQGIILDEKGNILTGQKRLWAVIYSGTGQYFRVSKGCPADTASLIDRGTPQSNRDLASRQTERKHSPTEASIVRALLAIKGKIKPTPDEMAEMMVRYSDSLLQVIEKTKGVRKTKTRVVMIAALIHKDKLEKIGELQMLAEKLDAQLSPYGIKKYWNRGGAFELLMNKAIGVCGG